MTKRAIAGLQLNDLVPNDIDSALPVIEWVDPSTLLVDEDYQRGLSEKSVRLIRRIVGHWQWSRFKPPVVAINEGGGREVLDGQHTAIAAATHPGVSLIPVLIVEAASQADRARAFVGQNRDRVAITTTQMHYSALAAGDEDALTIDQVCAKAGIRILKNATPGNACKPGDTSAIAAISALISRRGARAARLVLEQLKDLEPVSSTFIKAAEEIVHGKDFGALPEDIGALFDKMAPDTLERDAKLLAFSHKQPMWKAMAAVMFKNMRKRRATA
ncbi:MAG: hypothetical protein NVV72_01165 [Asticcacaulis sp.]|nr:hypothetical protein [Asticcacaulis sp.]